MELNLKIPVYRP